jgi:hypothetical protein
MVSEARLQELCKQSTGVPESLLGKPVTLLLDGKPVHLERPALRKQGSVMVPVALARRLDCKVLYRAQTGEILVSRQGRSQSFTLRDDGKGPRAFRWCDMTMVPARALLSALRIPFAWDAQNRELEVDA